MEIYCNLLMKKTYLIVLILFGVLLSKPSMSNPNQTCFSPEQGDSYYFGISVALNDKYLAIGDVGANRVIIYIRNNSGQWLRTKEILPPKDSTSYKIDYGFGRGLQLDGDVLVISALTQQETKEVTNPELFQQTTVLTSTFMGRYMIKLDSETEVQTIDLPLEKTPGFVHFNLLSEGRIRKITLPDNGEDKFGYSVALHKNLLLIGSPPHHTRGKGWLFDLDQPGNEPLKLDVQDAYMGDTVAISEQFAVVGDLGQWYYPQIDIPNLPPKTLIRSLSNASTTVIDSVGELSLSGNILAIMRSQSDGDEHEPLLEVFRLDSEAKPHLIIRRDYPIKRAWVQNGFLITVARKEDSHVAKICIEPLN